VADTAPVALLGDPSRGGRLLPVAGPPGPPDLDRPLDVVLHEVSIDGYRGRGTRAGRGDHLEAWIDHVLGGPDPAVLVRPE